MVYPQTRSRISERIGGVFMDVKKVKSLVVPAIALIAIAIVVVLAVYPSTGRETTKVRTGDLPVLQGLPLYVALDNGYFKDEGIEVERVRFDAPNQIIDALMQGQIDATSPSGALGISGIANQKNPGKILVYSVSGGTSQVPNENLLIPINSTISSVEELKGKRFGIIVGSIQWRTIARHVLNQSGLDMDKDVTIVELAPALQVPALANKQVDAMLALEPISTLAVQKDAGKILVKGPVEQMVADPLYLGAGLVSTSFARNNPETTKKFIRAIDRAIGYIREHPQESKVHLKGYTPLPDDLVQEAPVLIFKTCGELSAQDKESIAKFYEIFSRYGVVSSRIVLDDFLYCK